MHQPAVDDARPPTPGDAPDLLRILGILLIPIALLTAGLAFWAVTFEQQAPIRVIDRSVMAMEAIEPSAPSERPVDAAPRTPNDVLVSDQDTMPIGGWRSNVVVADSGRGQTYSEYTVQAGETLAEIAASHGVSVDSLVASNAHIRHQDMLLAGSPILIPALDGVLYGVSEGDTLQSIAALHGSTVGSIVAFPGNEISDLNQLPVGLLLLLLVPGGRAPCETTATAAATAAVRGDGQLPAPNVPVVGSLAGAAAASWLWPVDGRRITSSFGAAHLLGIDVGVPMRSRIFAANAGRVVFVGGDPCCSYGYYVDVDHGDGYRTRYAHVDEFLVGVGATVAAGQVIALSGNNGRSTGPHIHFEVRFGGVPVDPLTYLGKERGVATTALVSALPGGVRAGASAAAAVPSAQGRGGPAAGTIG